MRNIHLFIRRHYDTIKLVLLTIILVGVAALFIGDAQERGDASTQLDEASLKIIKEVKAQNDRQIQNDDRQTKELERQLQALCLVVIETAGADALKKLDPPLDRRCKNLADGESERRATKPAPAPVVTAPNQQPASPSERSNPTGRRPAVDRLEPVPPPKTEEPEEEPGLVRGLLDGLLGGLL